MMAAMRLRSLLLKMSLGVRFKMSMNSARFLGVYLGVGSLVWRYFSSLGSINLTNLRSRFSNMI